MLKQHFVASSPSVPRVSKNTASRSSLQIMEIASHSKQQGMHISDTTALCRGGNQSLCNLILINSLQKKIWRSLRYCFRWLLHDRSSCSECNRSATNNWLQSTYRPVHQIMNDEITAAKKTAEKKNILKDYIGQYCPSHSDTPTALDTAMRWIECQPRKKFRCNSIPYSTGGTWLCNTGKNWCNKCLKVKVTGLICCLLQRLTF